MQMREHSTTTKRQLESLIWSQLGMAGTEFYFFIDCANVEFLYLQLPFTQWKVTRERNLRKKLETESNKVYVRARKDANILDRRKLDVSLTWLHVSLT